MQASFISSLNDITESQWMQLTHNGNPFMRRDFLLAMEVSDVTCQKSGWQPMHLILTDHQGLVAFMSVYLKNHSYGEYVFDWSWADAWERYGLAYYPKLVSAVPYTPSQSQRILLRAGIQLADVAHLIFDTIRQQALRLGASSWHLLFPDDDENKQLEQAGSMTRLNCQFHWFNTGQWQDFEQFLGSFSSRKRKNVRQERKKVAKQNLSLRRVMGQEITEQELEHFYHCYHLTYMRRGRQGYLNKAFFEHIVRSMPEQIMLVIADYQPNDTTKPESVAAALFFYDEHSLYGRYWGSKVDADCLHFEACYYQGIEFCLEQGLQHFDPGTQGEHKISRGFHPVITTSNHWIAEEGFIPAIEQFIQDEAEHTMQYAEQACELLPYKEQ